MSGEARILREPLTQEGLASLAQATFGDMLKIVADIERGVVGAGGMLHVEAEEQLLEDGSEQMVLWGANYFPGRPLGERVEYTALINIRPSDDNPDQRILSEEVRLKVRALVEQWIGPP